MCGTGFLRAGGLRWRGLAWPGVIIVLSGDGGRWRLVLQVALPNAGRQFAGWMGALASGPTSCMPTRERDRTVADAGVTWSAVA